MRRSLWRASAALVFVALLAACRDGAAGPPTPEPTRTQGPTGTITALGQIAYVTPEGDLALANPDGSDPQVLREGGVVSFAWSPDGALLAAQENTGGGSTVVVLRSDGEQVFQLEGAADPLWSLAGDLAVDLGSGLLVVDTAGGELRTVADAVRPVWSPDGTALGFLRLDSEGLGVPLIVDIASGEEEPLAESIEPAEPVYPIAWNPAGNIIAYKDTLYEPDRDATRELPGVPVYWSPDGRWLLVTLEFDAESNATPANLLDFTQDGEALIGLEVRVAPDGTPPWLYIQRWTDWTADGRFLLYLDPQPFRNRLRIYDTLEIRQQINPDIAGQRPEYSPDGKHVAFDFEGSVWVATLDGSALVDVVEGTRPSWQP